MADDLRIVTSSEPIAEAAALLAAAARTELSHASSVRLAIPGGSALSALEPARRSLASDWARVRLTWLDERCVASSHPESNRGSAWRSGALCDGQPTLDELPLFETDETPEQSVKRVDIALRDRFEDALDILLLGLGQDGHIASLFPGAWQNLPDERVAFVADSPKPPRERITLCPRMLGSARHAVLLATGEDKRSALLRLRAGDPALPATGLRGLVVVTDLDLEANEGELQ